MTRPLTRRLTLESFEARNLPAPLTFSSDALGNVTISGTADNANGGLSLVATAPNTFDITDGATPVLTGLVISGNLTINLDASDDTVTLDLSAGGLGGNFSLNTGIGLDTFNFTGANPIAGNLSLTNVNISLPISVTIGGNTTITTASENAAINIIIFTDSVFGGDFRYTGGNTPDVVNLATSTVGGSVTLTMANSIGGTNTADLTGTTIGNNLTYTGGTGLDNLVVGDAVVGGSVNANMSAAISSLDNNAVTVTNTVIGRSLTVFGGQGIDVVAVDAATVVSSTAYISLGGGANDTDFLGQFGSTSGSFVYNGGAGVDDVTFTPSGGSRVRFTATLGAGNDVVAFGASAAPPSYAYIDFGAGTDSVTGTINFPFYFINLP